MAFDAYNVWDDDEPYPWVRNDPAGGEFEEAVQNWSFRKEEDLILVCKNTTHLVIEREDDAKLNIYMPDIHYRCWKRVLNDGNIEFFISFRGTDTFGNVITDIDLYQVCLDPDTMTEEAPGPDNRHIYVHRGFLKGYAAIRRLILEELKGKLESINAPITRIVFTGHSLGGALATLAAVDTKLIEHTLSIDDDNKSALPKIECHTFGAPHVGGAAFERYFNSIIDPNLCTRFTNALDIVPKVLTLVNLSEHFPGVDAHRVFQVSEKFQHAPATEVILGGAVDVGFDIIYAIVQDLQRAADTNGIQASVLKGLKQLGLSPVQQHRMPAYLAGIEAHLQGYARYLRIAKEVVEQKGIALVKDEAVAYVQEMTIEGVIEAGRRGLAPAARAGTAALVPWVGLLSGADLVVNVIGHAATNYQLVRLRSQVDKLSESVELLHEKVDGIDLQVGDIQITVHSLDEKMSTFKNQLCDISRAVGMIPDEVGNIFLNEMIRTLRAHMANIKTNITASAYTSSETIFLDVNQLGTTVERVVSAAADLLSLQDLSGNIVTKENRPSLAHKAILALCEASAMELNLHMYELYMLKNGSISWRGTIGDYFDVAYSKFIPRRETCSALVGRWIMQYGSVMKPLGAELSMLYGNIYSIKLNQQTKTVSLDIRNGLVLIQDDNYRTTGAIEANGAIVPTEEGFAESIAAVGFSYRGESTSRRFPYECGVPLLAHLLTNYRQYSEGVLTSCMRLVQHSSDGCNILRYMTYELPSYGLLRLLYCYNTHLNMARGNQVNCTLQSICNDLGEGDRRALIEAVLHSILQATDDSTTLDGVPPPVWVLNNMCETDTMRSILVEALSRVPSHHLACLVSCFIHSDDQIVIFELANILPEDIFVHVFVHLAAASIDSARMLLVKRKRHNEMIEVICFGQLWESDKTQQVHHSYLEKALDALYDVAEEKIHIARDTRITVASEDIDEVIRIVEKCTELNHAPSKAALGTMLLFGLGNALPVDQARAQQLWDDSLPDLRVECAKDEPSMYALFWLGCLTLHGCLRQFGQLLSDVEDEAMRSFSRAHSQAHRLAHVFLPQVSILQPM